MEELLRATLPGSLPFLLAGLTVGLGLSFWSNTAKWGRRWLVALVGVYWVMSIPLGSRAVAWPLSAGFESLATREAALGATAVVVLDGGTARCTAGGTVVEAVNDASALRMMEAARVSQLLDRPLVVVSGGTYEAHSPWLPEGQVIRDRLLEAGIPANRLVLDSTSRNTREHAVNLTRILREHAVARFVLVTSPTHMRRAFLAFRAQGADPVPSISALSCALPPKHFWQQLWPSPLALETSEGAARDYLGLVYYWSRGWL